MAEARYSLTVKVGKNNDLLTVRGDSYGEFSDNLNSVAEDQDFVPDLAKFYKQATGSDLVSLEQAIKNVQPIAAPQQPAPQPQAPTGWMNVGAPATNTANMPGPPPQQMGPGQTNDADFMCQHGQRQYKEGRAKNGKNWKGWFCPVKGGCEPKWVD